MTEIECPLPLRDRREIASVCAATPQERRPHLLFSFVDTKPLGGKIGDTFTLDGWRFVVYATSEYIAEYAAEEEERFSGRLMAEYLRLLRAGPSDVLYFMRYRLDLPQERGDFFTAVYK